MSMYTCSALSLAAYADLREGGNSTSSDINLSALQSAGMTQTQAIMFAEDWPEIVNIFIDSNSGLAVTVFGKTNANGDLIETAIAIRGTDTDNFLDFSKDVADDIVLGTGLIPDQFEALTDYYDSLIVNGDIDLSIPTSISGHSLGGYLAQLMGAFYPNDFDAIYSYKLGSMSSKGVRF